MTCILISNVENYFLKDYVCFNYEFKSSVVVTGSEPVTKKPQEDNKEGMCRYQICSGSFYMIGWMLVC